MDKFYEIVKNIKNYGNCQIYIANDRRIKHNYVTTLYVDENGELAAYWDLVINDKPYFYNDNIGADKTAGIIEIDEHDISKEDIPLTIVRIFCYSYFRDVLISKNETEIQQCHDINPDKAIKQLYDISSQMINLSLPELILFVKYPIDARINLLYKKIKDGIIESNIKNEEIFKTLIEKLTAFECNYLKVLYAWKRMQNATNEEDDIKFQQEYEEIVAIAEFIDSTKARLNSNQEDNSSLNQYYREYLEMLVKAQSVEEFQNLKKCFELGMSNYKDLLINSQQPSEKQMPGTYKK